MIKNLLLFFLTLTFLIGESKVIFSDTEDNAFKHNAFTDIYNNEGDLYVVFRSASSHIYEEDSKILIYKLPKNTTKWKKFKTIEDNSSDLRDPFFLPSKDSNTLKVYIRTRKRTIDQNLSFTRLYTIDSNVTYVEPNATYVEVDKNKTINGWPWRIREQGAWKVKYNNKNKSYYTIAYRKGSVSLYKSRDGIDNFEEVTEFNLSKFDCKLPTEADIVFKKDSIYTLLRCDGNNSLIGKAQLNDINNTEKWEFESTGKQLHSPSFLEIDGKIYVAFRDLSNKDFTIIGLSTLDDIKMKNNYRILYENKGHNSWDIGYPGMTILDGKIYISYYITKFDSNKTLINSSIIVRDISKQRKSVIHFPIFKEEKK